MHLPPAPAQRHKWAAAPRGTPNALEAAAVAMRSICSGLAALRCTGLPSPELAAAICCASHSKLPHGSRSCPSATARYTLRISRERARGGDRLRPCTIGPLLACALPTAADSDSATGSRAAPLYGASACCRSAPASHLGGKISAGPFTARVAPAGSRGTGHNLNSNQNHSLNPQEGAAQRARSSGHAWHAARVQVII